MVTLKGQNFNQDTRLFCPLPGGVEAEVFPFEVSSNEIQFVAPETVSDGFVVADNGSGRGNPLLVKSLFSPVPSVQFSDQGELQLSVTQAPEQLALASFLLSSRDWMLDTAAASMGDEIGTGHYQLQDFDAPLSLKITGIEEGSLLVDAVDTDYSDTVFQMKIGPDPDIEGMISVSFDPRGEDQPWGPNGKAAFILDQSSQLELTIGGVLKKVPDRRWIGLFDAYSSPLVPNLPESRLETQQVVLP